MSGKAGPGDGGELARRVARQMTDSESWVHALGIEIDEIGPGHCRLTIRIREDMTNGHGTCHGGLIYTLADAAIGYACNSYNESSVAHTAHVTYTSPGRVGERLTAEAVEVHRGAGSDIYDAVVRGEDGRLVATLRGVSRKRRGETVVEP